MVVHKELMDRIGPFDSVPLRLYDDVELGIRLSKLGYKVVVAPKAWVDHDKGHSDQFLADRTYVSERERIRTVLKYYPALRLPSWLMRERHLLRYLKSPNLYAVPFKAWGWNVLHLFSALKWRARFLLKPNHFWSLVHPSWGDYPPPVVGNDAFRPSPKLWRERLLLDGFSDCKQLNFGWYYPERDGLVTYRWTGPQASAFFNFESAFRSCSLKLLVPLPGQRVEVALRRLGEVESMTTIPIHCAASTWQNKSYRCNVDAGRYELLLSSDRTFNDSLGRTLGVAVSSIRFD